MYNSDETSPTKLIVVVLAAVLLVPAAASAKAPADARVLFTRPPGGLRAGRAWQARFWFVLPDGRPYRISGMHPNVAIQNLMTGAFRVVSVVQDDSTYYSARIVFPTRGRWSVRFRFDAAVGGGSRLLTTLRVA